MTDQVWTEDSATLDPEGFRRHGQHDGPEGTQHSFRWVWADGTPVEGQPGQWVPCVECAEFVDKGE